MSEQDWGPGRAGYAVAFAIFLIGAFVAAVFFGYVIYNIASLDDEMVRVPIPGTSEVTLDSAGRYTVFYERQDSLPDRGFETSEDAPGVEIEVTAVESGETISVSDNFGQVNYDFWSRSGRSVASFRIDQPGAYEISVDYVDSPAQEDAMLALGEGIGTTIIFTVIMALGSGAFFCGTIGVALIIVIITLVRRS